MSLARIVRLFPRVAAPTVQLPLFTITDLAKLSPQLPTRQFATDADVLKFFKKSQITRTSLLEPRAKELIAAIRSEDYAKAELLVKSGVNVDGHTSGENTPLTDAAARGDSKGTEFLLKNLKANPSASCHCPHHKTALHYAAENGHLETVLVLLKYGAQPNVLDSRKYTAIDVAKTAEIKQLLISHGGDVGHMIAADMVKRNRYLPK